MRANGAITTADRAKARMIVAMRRLHHRTLHESSARTYRRRVVDSSPAPRLVPAARRYKKMGWLPTSLLAAEKLPGETKLPPRYVVPYYAIGKIGWAIYGKSPIDPAIEYSPDGPFASAFPRTASDWGAPTDDAVFTALRLQGPNPFTLHRVDPDPAAGDAADAVCFALDFSELFAGVVPPTIARFTVVDDALTPTRIHVGPATHHPGDPGWDDAKRIVNQLDARYSAFIRHLLNTHLMVGQAYALAAYTLPTWHPLREFMDFFTYGTAIVNHYAYDALLTENSYFLRSNFVTPDDARLMMENAARVFDFDEWLVPYDLEKRGLDAIPGHPYVEDARTVWPAIVQVVERHLDDLDIRDADVSDDPDLAWWYITLARMLPDVDTIPPLGSRADLVNLLTALIYNNVIHEVCGNLSPILDAADPADKRGIDIDDLKVMAAGGPAPTPSAASVFLMEQASYVSSFNVTGNNLMTVNAARYIDDPKLRAAVEDLQVTLRQLDAELTARNAERTIPFLMMQPSKWEASVSF